MHRLGSLAGRIGSRCSVHLYARSKQNALCCSRRRRQRVYNVATSTMLTPATISQQQTYLKKPPDIYFQKKSRKGGNRDVLQLESVRRRATRSGRQLRGI